MVDEGVNEGGGSGEPKYNQQREAAHSEAIKTAVLVPKRMVQGNNHQLSASDERSCFLPL